MWYRMALVAVLALPACSAGSGTGAVPRDCRPRHSFRTHAMGTLTVSTYTYAPATIVKGDDLEGVEGGLLKQVARWECLKLKIIEQAPAGVIPAVQAGRADIAAASWYRTRERAQVLNLTDPIYTDTMTVISKNGMVTTVDQLRGRRVGTLEGNLWNADLQRFLGGRLKIYGGETAVYQDLRAGRIDVAIDGAGGATNMVRVARLSDYRIQTPPPHPAVKATSHPGQITWPNTKNNAALNSALNADIAELRRTGLISELLKKNGYPDSAAHVSSPSLL
jgi:polar amino acid transport system substrate-binding protein